MAKAQRKDEILKSELPPTLPLMALRSTIVYPLGTIAVQMGAPENLVAAPRPRGAGTRSSRWSSRAAITTSRSTRSDSSGASASRRACTSASISRATPSRSRCRDCGASSIDEMEQTEPYPDRARFEPAQETPADPNEVDDLVTRVVVGRRDARRAGRSHSGRSAGDPQDERLRSGAVRRPRGDEHELPHLRQGRGASAPRRRPAAALHPHAPRARSRRARA